MAVKPPEGPERPKRPPSAPAPSSNPTAPAPKRAPPATTPGRLAHDANFYRARTDASPDLGEMLDRAPAPGASRAELMPGASARGHPDLPATETRPPPFLGPLAAMKDIYLRVKGRASPKTVDLLEGVALEDLLERLGELFADERLRERPDARICPPLFRQLEGAPGPLLLGLNDPRLTEPWRVFLDGWDIWRPDGHDHDGVELFWEGEGEDDEGCAIEAAQSLVFLRGELTLHTRLGRADDRLTFDGEAFYRLRPRASDRWGKL